MKLIDIILALITGEAVAWFFSGLFKDLGIDVKLLSWALPILFPILAVLGLWISWLLGKKFLFIFQAAKFLLIGALATLVDLGTFKFLRLIFIFNAGWLFKTIAFIVATFAKYWGNKFWAFEKMGKTGMGKEMTQFYLVTLIGLGIDVGIFSIIVNMIGPQFGIPLKTWETIGVLIPAIAVASWNFFGYKFFVFKK